MKPSWELQSEVNRIRAKLDACKGKPIMTRVYLKQMAGAESQLRAAKELEKMYVR